MTRMTESAIGLALLALTFLCGLVGLVADFTAFADAPALYGAALVAGVAAVAVALDESRRIPGRARQIEVVFGRALLGIAILLGIVATIAGLQNDDTRNLWLVLALIVDLDALAVIVDTRRLILARGAALAVRPLADGALGAIAAGVGLGLGVFGFFSGLLGNPHAAALLQSGVVLSLLAVAILFDEQAHVAAKIRGKGRRFGS